MKKTNFIIGKYYKYFYFYDVYIFKLKEIIGDDLILDLEYYFYKNIIQKNDENHIIYRDNDAFKEVNIKDIIDLLPNDNIDKINYMRKNRIKSLLDK